MATAHEKSSLKVGSVQVGVAVSLTYFEEFVGSIWYVYKSIEKAVHRFETLYFFVLLTGLVTMVAATSSETGVAVVSNLTIFKVGAVGQWIIAQSKLGDIVRV